MTVVASDRYRHSSTVAGLEQVRRGQARRSAPEERHSEHSVHYSVHSVHSVLRMLKTVSSHYSLSVKDLLEVSEASGLEVSAASSHT